MRLQTVWLQAEISAIRAVTPSVREFSLRPVAGAPRPIRPGAHIDVALLVDGRPDTRSYSLVGRSGEDCYRIAVKLSAESRGGSHAMWQLTPGARLTISEPKSSFAVEPGRSTYLLIAGGIGITPLVGVAEELRASGMPVSLLQAARNRDELAYRERLTETLGARYAGFSSADDERIDLRDALATLPEGGLAAICGPIAMLDAARAAWHALGRKPGDLRWETFGCSGTLPTEMFRVLPRFDQIAEVPASRSLLQALEAEGVEIVSECQCGQRDLCAGDALACESPAAHREILFSDEQKHDERTLCACVSRAHGTIVIDTAYRPD